MKIEIEEQASDLQEDEVETEAEAIAEDVTETEDEATEAAAEATEAEEELVVTIGDEPPEEDQTAGAAPWVRDLRKSHREAQKRIRELEEQAARLMAGDTAATIVGKKPTMEDCDYDADEFERKLIAWNEQKRAKDEAEAKAKQAQEAEHAAWQEKLKNYGESKASLKAPDFEDAESAVLEQLNTTQQGIIVKVADNPALLVYALGKSPKNLKELAEIKDPLLFTRKLSKIEDAVKQTKRTAPPPPERQVSGTGGKSGAIDNQLDRLRAEAERTGDMTKLLAYKRQKRA